MKTSSESIVRGSMISLKFEAVPLRERDAVELVGQAVEAVGDRLVVRKLHDARHRLDEIVETLPDRIGIDLLVSEGVDADGCRGDPAHQSGLRVGDLLDRREVDVQRRNRAALHVDRLTEIRDALVVRHQRVTSERHAVENEVPVGARRRLAAGALAAQCQRNLVGWISVEPDYAANESGRIGKRGRKPEAQNAKDDGGAESRAKNPHGSTLEGKAKSEKRGGVKPRLF